MKNRWSDADAASVLERYAPGVGEDVALRLYTARLIGAEPDLVLHGGGNVSVKTTLTDVLGRTRRALLVKASGADLAALEPEGLAAVDLDAVEDLRGLEDLSDAMMAAELSIRALRSPAPAPSIEALAHAFLPGKFVDHTHADAVLALTNQAGGEGLVREALGEDVLILAYVRPGFRLAKAAAELLAVAPERRGMVWAKHGLVTWGETPRESYEAMIDLVSRAEEHLERIAAAGRSRPAASVGGEGGSRGGEPSPRSAARRVRHDAAAKEGRDAAPSTGADEGSPGRPAPPLAAAEAEAARIAPVLRGLLALPTEDADRPHRTVVVRLLATPEILSFLGSPGAGAAALTPPLTADHLIRTKALPMWADLPESGGGPGAIREALARALAAYAEAYLRYLARHEERMPPGLAPFDATPRVVVVPGVGAFCSGSDAAGADIVRDITEHTLRIKAKLAHAGRYEGLSEEHLFDMEYHVLQGRKLSAAPREPLEGRVALVTGAAGAIGSGVCRALLEAGCHVAATDLPGGALDDLEEELRAQFGERAIGAPLDVTDPSSAALGFDAAVRAWGGVDLVVVNAGAAHVSTLAAMDLEAFRRLQSVNVEGTLLVLREAARLFELQGTGGDIVLISTKNVAAPGAGFGAYSATKAAAHQLGRIASLEMAPLDVRVNMVAPDAVFSEGARRSGLWEQVGPERMRSRGLDEKGLEEYYRGRNLLEARITARHVARAVLFFATRQTPTTGATLPVDGGLPDATPR